MTQAVSFLGSAILLAAAGLAVAPSPQPPLASIPTPQVAELEAQVAEVERAFARTMAERDHEAFVSFLADEAIFLRGATPLRGRDAVASGWAAFFEGADAPFAWEPETVAVLESGNLALSTGPVRGPDGRRHSTYTSIWRQEEPGVWRIVLDKGDRYCPPE